MRILNHFLVFVCVFNLEFIKSDNDIVRKYNLLYSFVIFINITLFLKYCRFTRVRCSASEKTCITPYCKLKLVNKTYSLMNVGCKDGLKRVVKYPLVIMKY